jgi:hypothetical protein
MILVNAACPGPCGCRWASLRLYSHWPGSSKEYAATCTMAYPNSRLRPTTSQARTTPHRLAECLFRLGTLLRS